jgi:hypothetical protein
VFLPSTHIVQMFMITSWDCLFDICFNLTASLSILCQHPFENESYIVALRIMERMRPGLALLALSGEKVRCSLLETYGS